MDKKLKIALIAFITTLAVGGIFFAVLAGNAYRQISSDTAAVTEQAADPAAAAPAATPAAAESGETVPVTQSELPTEDAEHTTGRLGPETEAADADTSAEGSIEADGQATQSAAADTGAEDPQAQTGSETPVQAAPAVRAESGTPLANHGELSVRGTQLVDKNGAAYQLHGVSTHGIGWFPEYVNKAAFQTLRDEWGVNCIRIAMYTGEGGYCTGGDRSQLKTLVTNGVSYATELGMYVIIDWHILSDNDPNRYKAEAIEFFREMSAKYADYDNVLYEICNEPNGGTSWAAIKSYAEEVIPVIKENNRDAIIIVGTPTWSQDVDQAAADPIRSYTNIMYTIHFYAGTHKDSLRQKMRSAISSGLPIFCTEFGTCDASGNGGNDFNEAEKWIATMDAAGVSYCIWNLSNKNESSALIASSCSKTSGWSMNELSAEGQWYVNILGNGVTPGTVVTPEQSSDNNGGNNGNNGGNNAPAATAAVTASSDNTQVTVTNSGTWNSGSANCYQYTVTIRNTGNAPVSNWKISAEFDTSVTLDQSWSGTYTLNGKTVEITPVDYNKTIDAGASVELGFIVSASGNVETPRVTIR